MKKNVFLAILTGIRSGNGIVCPNVVMLTNRIRPHFSLKIFVFDQILFLLIIQNLCFVQLRPQRRWLLRYALLPPLIASAPPAVRTVRRLRCAAIRTKHTFCIDHRQNFTRKNSTIFAIFKKPEKALRQKEK